MNTPLTGPERLLKTMLGIDPREMEATIKTMIANVNEMHKFMGEIRGRLERIEAKLGVDDVRPSGETQPFPAIEDHTRSAANG